MKKILFFFLIILSINILAQESFLSWNVDAILTKDGTLTITENINTKIEGNIFKRGITRGIPTSENHLLRKKIYPYKLLAIQKDGEDEFYYKEPRANGVFYKIGNKNILLKKGTYNYTLKYKIDRQIQYNDDYEILFWNVSPHDISVPIKKASFTITVPEGANNIDYFEVYTGKAGEKTGNYKDEIIDNKLHINIPNGLKKGEIFSVKLFMIKGTVLPISNSAKIKYLIMDYKGVLISIIGIGILFAFYLISWFKVGIDPEKGTIIPRFYPPEDFSPQSLGFIEDMGFSNKLFTSAIINMAIKGFLMIEEDDKKKEFTLVKKSDDMSVLDDEEKVIALALFSDNTKSIQKEIAAIKKSVPLKYLQDKIDKVVEKNIKELKNTDRITLKTKNSSKIIKAKSNFQDILDKKYNKRYFNNNNGWTITGFLFSFLLIVISSFLSGGNPAIVLFFSVWLSFWNIAVYALVGSAIKNWIQLFKCGSGIGSAISLTFFSLPFVIADIFALYFFGYQVSFVIIPFIIIVMFLNFLFAYLLKAPTYEGRKIMDYIEGFKRYLSVAEKNYMDKLNPPENTPELFEKYLPYAFALGVEHRWSEKFDSILKRAIEQKNYTPTFYSRNGARIANLTGFTTSLNSSFSSAIASSSSVSSGSSGGAGGGGGGGSAGGW